jgi:hypothetical protein
MLLIANKFARLLCPQSRLSFALLAAAAAAAATAAASTADLIEWCGNLCVDRAAEY